METISLVVAVAMEKVYPSLMKGSLFAQAVVNQLKLQDTKQTKNAFHGGHSLTLVSPHSRSTRTTAWTMHNIEAGVDGAWKRLDAVSLTDMEDTEVGDYVFLVSTLTICSS